MALLGWLEELAATTAVEEDVGWSCCIVGSVLHCEGLEVEGLILQLYWRKLSIAVFICLLFTESCPNQGPKCKPDKNFFRWLIPLRLNIADNLQIDEIKLAVGNTWGNAKLSWFKDSSSAEEDLLSCATCGWTIEMGRP